MAQTPPSDPYVPHEHDSSGHVVLSERRGDDRRVAVATLVGTAVEWYDYFIYANAAAIVFAPLFFEPFVQSMGGAGAQILSFATIGVSFFFRPLGALVAGHLGDKLGRKVMLVLTLVMMGAATALIGVVPTYQQVGVAAPIILVILRILQGFSAGGEWGGAALMAVEHAPANRRGFFGGFPQIGVPVGMLLATLILAAVSAFTTEEQFTSWGWRIPFLLSVVLIVIGYFIRRGVSESPVFEEIAEEDEQVRLPLVQMFRFSGKQLIQGALTFAGNNAMGYMVTGGYILAYTTNPEGMGMDRTTVLNLISLGAAAWIVTTLIGAVMSDRIKRVRTMQLGFIAQLVWVVPMFLLVEQARPVLLALALIGMSVGIGLSYGPLSAMFVEMFPAKVRYSGAGLAYALGSILGGAFAPMIATALYAKFGTNMAVAAYLAIVSLMGLIAVSTIKDRTGKPLGHDAHDIEGQDRLESELATNPELSENATEAHFDRGAGY